MADAPGDKVGRGAQARTEMAKVDVLPPDPRYPNGGALEAGRLLRGITQTPGTIAFREGVNPKAIARRCKLMLAEAMPDITAAAIAMAKNADGKTDQRVAAVMINAISDRVIGKAGESAMDDGGVAAGGTMNVRLLTADERAELNTALSTIARLRAVAKSREGNA